MRYKEWNVTIYKGRYSNGRVALELIDADDGEGIATATVNIPEESLNEGEAFIKDYSENEGMLAWLIKNKLAEDTGRRVQSGWVQCPVVKLL